MIDFENNKTETLLEEAKAPVETTVTDLELKAGSTEIVKPEGKLSRLKRRLSDAVPAIIMCVVIPGIFGGAGVAMFFAYQANVNDEYNTALSSISETIDDGAEGLPGSTRVSGSFGGDEGTVSYKDEDRDLLNSESVAGAEGDRYRISGTVDHYTVEVIPEAGRHLSTYSYDSVTEKITKKD